MNAHTVVLKPEAAVPVASPRFSQESSVSPESSVSEKDRVVSDSEFEAVVRGALEAVGGTLLFRMLVGDEDQKQHAAAAFVGVRDSRQFLVLTLPMAGGQLKVETAARSSNPVAKIAASYAGVAEAFAAAA